ncbi:MAG: serine/threonine protein kinase [Polyangiaceae bacterium]|nr:serine/threonine protein kinase [Polyangiaceae bacterium]
MDVEEVLPVTDSMLIDDESEALTEVLAVTVRAQCMRCGIGLDAQLTLARAQRLMSLCTTCRGAILHQPVLAPGYRLVRELGCGAMGCVFLVYNEALEQRRALKQIIPNATLTPAEWTRALGMFLREAREQAALRHPNIVEVYDVVHTQGAIPAIVMEYVEGISAEKLLETEGHPGLPLSKVLHIAFDALAALDHAHRAGVVHRDVKEGNLIVARDDTGRMVTKLADFGLARSYQQSGLSGLDTPEFMAGTVPYMPPEQVLRFRDVKPPGDVYAMGATLYRLLTGLYPLAAHNDDRSSAFLAILETPHVPIAHALPAIPPAIGAVVDRALAKDPGHRWPDAGAMLHALRAAVPQRWLSSSEARRRPHKQWLHRIGEKIVARPPGDDGQIRSLSAHSDDDRRGVSFVRELGVRRGRDPRAFLARSIGVPG